MALFHLILLLAAYSRFVVAGPVPRNNRRQLPTSYTNITSTRSSASDVVKFSASPIINADTGLIIEPLQRTVITQVQPAVTFLDPKGNPLATQDAQTVLLTSYFTPTNAPTPSSLAGSVPSINTASSLSPSLVASSSQSKISPASSSLSVQSPASSQGAIASGSLKITSIPSFTYAPGESKSGQTVASPTPVLSSRIFNSTSLAGSDHPGLGMQSAQSTSVVSSPVAVESPAVPKTTAQTLSLPTSSSTLPVSSSIRISDGVQSTAFVIKTEYTTVYPSTPAVTLSSAAASQSRPPSMNTSSVAEVSTSVQIRQSVTYTSSPLSASLVPTPLSPPAVVIVTQYTTILPTSTAVPLPAPPAPNTSAASASTSAPISSVASPTSLALPSFSSSVTTTPLPSPPVAISSSGIQSTRASNISSASTQSALPIAPSASPAVSTTLAVQSSIVSSSASRVVPSPTSDNPLVITPIAPSQMFTVTVTTTEKETVTETATVSVTVRA